METTTMTAPATPAKTLQVRQDWNNDGFLRIEGARTIRLYLDLQHKMSELPVDQWGLFFAFSAEQFEDGYKGLVKRGMIKDGDRIKSFGHGCYGIKAGMERWAREVNAIEDRIRQECDPYEVYLEEFNNYECCIDWDGDDRAVERVIGIYGLERTQEALRGKRFRAINRVEDIAEMMNKN